MRNEKIFSMRNAFLPLLILLLLFLFPACREKEEKNLSLDRIAGIRLGEKRFPRNGEGRKILLNDAVLTGDFRMAYAEVIPFDHRLCAIFLIAPEMPPEENDPEKRVAEELQKNYSLAFKRTSEGFLAVAGEVEVLVCRNYRFGPQAVSARFRSLPLASLAEKARATERFRRTEKRAAALEEIAVLEAALREYYQDMGYYPATLSGLFRPPALAKNWQGPYLERFNGQDPWGRDYCYHCFPDGQKYLLFSSGEDGQSVLH